MLGRGFHTSRYIFYLHAAKPPPGHLKNLAPKSVTENPVAADWRGLHTVVGSDGWGSSGDAPCFSFIGANG